MPGSLERISSLAFGNPQREPSNSSSRALLLLGARQRRDQISLVRWWEVGPPEGVRAQTIAYRWRH